jgi:tripartite-type tricarboxylate transporter receptor subunit TctC
MRTLVVSALLLAAPAVLAQGSYPNRPVTMLVGFAPGGGTDITARIIARHLSEGLGQQVVVENRPGAGGNIATELVAKAAPDGYVIGLTSVGPLAVAPHMLSKLPYDPRVDLAPIGLAVTLPNVLVVHPSLAATSLAEFVKLAAAKPGSVTYGSSGVGGIGHLAGALLGLMARVDLVHVPYKGGSPAMTDLLGGQVQSIFATTATGLPHIKTGKIRALAVTGSRRSPILPGVPTVAESGYPGYEASNWYAYVAPAKTPREIIERLNRGIVRALNSAEVREQLAPHGIEPTPSTPEEMARQIERELEIWGRVVKQAGLKTE